MANRRGENDFLAIADSFTNVSFAPHSTLKTGWTAISLLRAILQHLLSKWSKWSQVEDVQQALKGAGLESSNLIVAVDFTKVGTSQGPGSTIAQHDQQTVPTARHSCRGCQQHSGEGIEGHPRHASALAQHS